RPAEIFFSFYFAMTGMHALHMIIGIGLLTVLIIKARRAVSRLSTIPRSSWLACIGILSISSGYFSFRCSISWGDIYELRACGFRQALRGDLRRAHRLDPNYDRSCLYGPWQRFERRYRPRDCRP